jgi:hypothetical protein
MKTSNVRDWDAFAEATERSTSGGRAKRRKASRGAFAYLAIGVTPAIHNEGSRVRDLELSPEATERSTSGGRAKG